MARSWRGLVTGFALGLLAATPLFALALFPAQVRAAWAHLRWGAVPSDGGVALVLEPAPAGVAGPGGGPWVVAWFVNTSAAPAPLCWSDPPGEELSFEVTLAGADGPLPPRRAAGDATVTTAAPIRRTWLPPGGRVGLRCDLSRSVAIPAAGALDVRATRAPWGDPREGFDGVRCESNTLRLRR